MPTMERQLLAYTLYIFGATHDPQTRPLIAPFRTRPDPEVREEARLVAAEISAVESEGPTHNS